MRTVKTSTVPTSTKLSNHEMQEWVTQKRQTSQQKPHDTAFNNQNMKKDSKIWIDGQQGSKSKGRFQHAAPKPGKKMSIPIHIQVSFRDKDQDWEFPWSPIEYGWNTEYRRTHFLFVRLLAVVHAGVLSLVLLS